MKALLHTALPSNVRCRHPLAASPWPRRSWKTSGFFQKAWINNGLFKTWHISRKKTMGPTCWSLSILSIMRCSFRSLHNSTKVALSLKGVKHKQLHPHDEDTTFLTALMSKLGTTKEDSLHRFFPGLRMAVDLVAGTGTKVAGPPSSSLSVVTSSNFLMGNKTKRYKIHLKNKSKIYTDFVKSVLGKSSLTTWASHRQKELEVLGVLVTNRGPDNHVFVDFVDQIPFIKECSKRYVFVFMVPSRSFDIKVMLIVRILFGYEGNKK